MNQLQTPKSKEISFFFLHKTKTTFCKAEKLGENKNLQAYKTRLRHNLIALILSPFLLDPSITKQINKQRENISFISSSKLKINSNLYN